MSGLGSWLTLLPRKVLRLHFTHRNLKPIDMTLLSGVFRRTFHISGCYTQSREGGVNVSSLAVDRRSPANQTRGFLFRTTATNQRVGASTTCNVEALSHFPRPAFPGHQTRAETQPAQPFDFSSARTSLLVGLVKVSWAAALALHPIKHPFVGDPQTEVGLIHTSHSPLASGAGLRHFLSTRSYRSCRSTHGDSWYHSALVSPWT